jgi:hypothetical protein
MHRIQGISDEFIPPIVDLDQLDGVVSVDDGDAILMAQKLASELGLGVGISSGANFLGALQVQRSLGDGAVVVTVFPDDNKKYLSTLLPSGRVPRRPSCRRGRRRTGAPGLPSAVERGRAVAVPGDMPRHPDPPMVASDCGP